jgi:serine protease AprX
MEDTPSNQSGKKKAKLLESVENDFTRPKMGRATVPPELNDADKREEWGLPREEDKQGSYMVELNLLYYAGLDKAATRFKSLFKGVVNDNRQPIAISKSYYKCMMTVYEWRKLVNLDEKKENKSERVIYRLWPDYRVKPLMDRSITTVKADAAVRSYDATGERIIWAVIDSGIDGKHLHFGGDKDINNPDVKTLYDSDVARLHRDFTIAGEPAIDSALVDNFGHGTHVAGIIAGGLPSGLSDGKDYIVYEKELRADASGKKTDEVLKKRSVPNSTRLRGVAPQCKLISLKVLGDDGTGYASDVMRALQYIRDGLNGDPKLLRVQGVNLSIGYEFDAEIFACGQSPLCIEVDRLVKSGVVVVVAAGNTGYGTVASKSRATKVGLANTINDPGNAALAITVGATHRDSPHIYGVSYFSSKGPTGDGRLKPDLVAPGERITSCAAGRWKNRITIPEYTAAYVDDTGTSMAAPHVSGAIAAFLSIRREFIGRPEEVKRIFLENATPLGREKYFEGHGLLDLMRSIQSV